ncbi:MAG: ABC transporter permease subunit, partial [Propionibacteriaceae bacterium]|nr:ABC transporter permease subunit [Propionibacteriaceae bacterium]
MSAQTVLFDAPGPKARQRHLILTIVGSIAILAILALALYQLGVRGQLEAAKWTPFLTASPWANYLIPGLIGTLSAAAVSVIAAGILGLLLGIGRLSHTAWVRWISGILVEFFRAVPVLIMMIFVYFLYALYDVFPSKQLALAGVVTGLTLYNAAVIAE